MVFWEQREKVKHFLLLRSHDAVKVSSNIPPHPWHSLFFSPPVYWDAWRSYSTCSVVVKIKCNDIFSWIYRSIAQRLELMYVPSVTHLWGWILVNDIRGRARHFHKVSHPDVSAWLRHDSSFSVESLRLRKDGDHHWPRRGVGKKPRFKNTNLTRVRPYIYENRVCPAEFQRSQMVDAMRNPSQIPKDTTWRHILGPLRFVSLRRCYTFTGFRRRTERKFLACVTFTDELSFIMTVGMDKHGHLGTVVSLHLSAETETRVSFNAEPADSGWPTGRRNSCWHK